MDERRYAELMKDDEGVLTEQELKQGWHFCPEWDYLLIGPSMPESQFCYCEIGGAYYKVKRVLYRILKYVLFSIVFSLLLVEWCIGLRRLRKGPWRKQVLGHDVDFSYKLLTVMLDATEIVAKYFNLHCDW